jgi:hypothetical protein
MILMMTTTTSHRLLLLLSLIAVSFGTKNSIRMVAQAQQPEATTGGDNVTDPSSSSSAACDTITTCQDCLRAEQECGFWLQIV